MGSLHVNCVVANHIHRNRRTRLRKLLVDTGSDYTWIPATALTRIGVAEEKCDVAFVMANGQTITRSVGFALICVNGHFTIDEDVLPVGVICLC